MVRCAVDVVQGRRLACGGLQGGEFAWVEACRRGGLPGEGFVKQVQSSIGLPSNFKGIT